VEQPVSKAFAFHECNVYRYDAVWKKFHITRANKRQDFRLQIDHAGRAANPLPPNR
jgi:uncharacterized protein YpiB (UPF0302 family)